jgi:hypothetical protein
MQTKEVLREWYIARHTFLGLDGRTRDPVLGRRRALAVADKVPEARWLCDTVSEADSRKGVEFIQGIFRGFPVGDPRVMFYMASYVNEGNRYILMASCARIGYPLAHAIRMLEGYGLDGNLYAEPENAVVFRSLLDSDDPFVVTAAVSVLEYRQVSVARQVHLLEHAVSLGVSLAIKERARLCVARAGPQNLTPECFEWIAKCMVARVSFSPPEIFRAILQFKTERCHFGLIYPLARAHARQGAHSDYESKDTYDSKDTGKFWCMDLKKWFHQCHNRARAQVFLWQRIARNYNVVKDIRALISRVIWDDRTRVYFFQLARESTARYTVPPKKARVVVSDDE